MPVLPVGHACTACESAVTPYKWTFACSSVSEAVKHTGQQTSMASAGNAVSHNMSCTLLNKLTTARRSLPRST